jgi:uncharacterized alkaline shock family protein YloU
MEDVMNQAPEEDIEAVTEEEDNIGNIKISVDVVSTIAGIAAGEIDGVANMYSSLAGEIAEKFGAKKNPAKGVKVEMKEDGVVIDLYIVVDYGVKIPEMAWEIQESVKSNVETMTGLEVEKVNIHVEGVSFVKEKERLIAQETMQAIEEEVEQLPLEEQELEELPEQGSEGL